MTMNRLAARRISLLLHALLVYRVKAFVSSPNPLFGARHSSHVVCEASQATTTTETSSTCNVPQELDDNQVDFTRGYLNKHHSDTLLVFANVFSSLGATASSRNAFSGGSYQLMEAKIVDINTTMMEMEVIVKDRQVSEPITELVSVSLDSDPISQKRRQFPPLPPLAESITRYPAIDQTVRKLNRLCNTVNEYGVTGKLVQLASQLGGTGIGVVKENLYLNNVPYGRQLRKYFYDMAAEATLEAVIECSNGERSNRMKMVQLFPEMNPDMDSYRIGTLLELARTIAIRLAEENLRVRLCVQGSVGVGIFTGVPKQLNGVSVYLQRMDYQSGEGEENEGMVGEYIRFGAIGKEHVVNKHVDETTGETVEQDDVFILLCPQNMVGLESSIMGVLQEMVEAAGDRPVVLINPNLEDKQSSQGQQSVRGRKERMEFTDSFETIYHYQNIYISGTSYWPILGSVTKLRPSEPWVAHQRRDRANNEGEVYIPMMSSEQAPDSQAILSTFEK